MELYFNFCGVKLFNVNVFDSGGHFTSVLLDTQIWGLLFTGLNSGAIVRVDA